MQVHHFNIIVAALEIEGIPQNPEPVSSQISAEVHAIFGTREIFTAATGKGVISN
jgi:hypothetical protein